MTTEKRTNIVSAIFRSIFLMSVVTFFVTQWTMAQSPADPKRGAATGASYSLSDIENINLTNGNLTLNLPIVQTPKTTGGLSGAFGLSYNSKLYKPVIEDIVVSNQ